MTKNSWMLNDFSSSPPLTFSFILLLVILFLTLPSSSISGLWLNFCFVCMFVRVCTYVCVYACAHTNKYARTPSPACVCLCIRMCVSNCVVCMFVLIDLEFIVIVSSI